MFHALFPDVNGWIIITQHSTRAYFTTSTWRVNELLNASDEILICSQKRENFLKMYNLMIVIYWVRISGAIKRVKRDEKASTLDLLFIGRDSLNVVPSVLFSRPVNYGRL